MFIKQLLFWYFYLGYIIGLFIGYLIFNSYFIDLQNNTNINSNNILLLE